MPPKKPSDVLREIEPDLPEIPSDRPESLLELGKALRAHREARGLTLDELAAKTRISKPYLSNIETARSPGPPSEEKLKAIAKALQLPAAQLLAAADWLRTPASIRQALKQSTPPRHEDGTINLDAMLPKSQPKQQLQPDGTFPVRSVPLLNKVPAGRASDFGDLSYPPGIADQYVPAPDLPDAPAASAFALKVYGDSMAPEYADGEILIFAPTDPKDGDDCVVRLGELEQFATTFKRIFYVMEGEEVTAVRLVPLNPRYPERQVPIADVTGIYPVMYRLTPAKGAAKPEVQQPQSFTSRISIEHD